MTGQGDSSPFYSYESRQGVLPVSWQDFVGTCKGLALAAAEFEPDVILGIARGGLYPATLLSHMLRAELYPIRVTSRFKDEVVHQRPVWLVRPPDSVTGQKVLIVDEICSEGRTLSMVRDEATRLGAAEVRSAVMYAHTWGQDIPHYIGIISDALILNPWDREVVEDGQFVPHPEYVHAFGQQGMEPPAILLSDIRPHPLDKRR